MEALGVGLEAIGRAISNIAIGGTLICLATIFATSILLYTRTVTFDDVKDFFKRNKDRKGRYR